MADEPVLWPYPIEAISSGGRGQVLFPWPNRTEDGTYEFEGTSCQAPLDEPERHNAIHGLVRWLRWAVAEESAESVRLGCAVSPQPGYRWRVALDLTYTVIEGGLHVRATILNHSSRPAPVGLGFHPYLDAGPRGVDGCSLTVPASAAWGRRAGPAAPDSEDVAGTRYDLREGPALVGLQLDDCYTGLSGGPLSAAAPEATWAVQLTTGDGHRRALWAGEGFGYVMCYTGDTLSPADRRRAVAVEPMTCPPNALRSGESIIVVPPGGRWTGTYGIRDLPRA